MELGHGPTTDASLLRRLKDPANNSAWSVFKGRYEPVIVARCRGWHLQPADTEEVTSIVLAKLVQSLASFEYDPARRFRGWLKTLVDNAIKDFWGNQQRRPGATGSGDTGVHKNLEQVQAPDLPSVSEHRFEDAEWIQLERAWEVVERVRERIENTTWRSYWLTAMEGRPAKEVAQELGISTAAVYQNKKRVGDRLRREALALSHETVESTEVPP